jgi:predicted ArsR family transcriptional regulator
MSPRYQKSAKEIIIELLKKEKRPIKASEIAKKTGINYNTVRGRLQDLKKKKLIDNTPDGWIYLE